MEQKRILIVDDDMLFHIIGSTFLKRESYTISFAHSGREALEKARTLQPDLALLDYEMGDMKGCEVCEELKSDQDTQHIPVIIITSPLLDEAREQCLAAGCRALLLKPTRREDLVSLVEEILNEPQRAFARASVNLPVTVRIHGREDDAVIRSLSVAGAFIVMATPPKLGEPFEVSFTTLGLHLEIPLPVEVVWTGKESKKSDTGVGVKFLEIGYIERELLTRYVMKKLLQIETSA